MVSLAKVEVCMEIVSQMFETRQLYLSLVPMI